MNNNERKDYFVGAITHTGFTVACAVFLLIEFWILTWGPIIVVLLNTTALLLYLLPGVSFANWFLGVHNNEVSISYAFLSLVWNFLGLAMLLAALFSFGDIVDGDRNVVDGAWNQLYLAVITITTLGYGNLVPSGIWAEAVAMFGAVVGYIGFALIAGIFSSVFYSKIVENNSRGTSQ